MKMLEFNFIAHQTTKIFKMSQHFFDKFIITLTLFIFLVVLHTDLKLCDAAVSLAVIFVMKVSSSNRARIWEP